MESHSLKRYLPYFGLLVLFGFGIWLIVATGSRLYSERTVPAASVASPSVSHSLEPLNQSDSARIFRDNLRTPLSILLLQLVVIIVVTRLVGKLFQKFGQPAVLGEI